MFLWNNSRENLPTTQTADWDSNTKNEARSGFIRNLSEEKIEKLGRHRTKKTDSD